LPARIETTPIGLFQPDPRQTTLQWLNPAHVTRLFRSEVGAILAWVMGSLVIAAAVSPWIYRAGKHLAATAVANDLPALLEWLGAACGRAGFGRFFDRSMLLGAMILLPLLLRRIGKLRSDGGRTQANPAKPFSGNSVVVQILVGCAISGTMLWGMGTMLEIAGAYVPRASSPEIGKILSKVFFPAIAASLVEEWLFRGLLLGIWLRCSRPLVACAGTSLLFAALHFLNPPPGTFIDNPPHAFAGFQLLGGILSHFSDPLFFITDFASLLAVGLILAWARFRTGALWFSIGLHTGWIMALKGFNLFYQKVPDHFLSPWGIGDTLRSGTFPLVTLATTALICHFVLPHFQSSRTAA
jgi:membrane protease YdiL (CAAX protease family)